MLFLAQLPGADQANRGVRVPQARFRMPSQFASPGLHTTEVDGQMLRSLGIRKTQLSLIHPEIIKVKRLVRLIARMKQESQMPFPTVALLMQS